jgi:hypothetical protein
MDDFIMYWDGEQYVVSKDKLEEILYEPFPEPSKEKQKENKQEIKKDE